MKLLQIQQAHPSVTRLKSTESSAVMSSSDFLPAIFHELKTPLSAISGFAQNLQQLVRNPSAVEECEESIKEIIAVVEDMNEIIIDLLDVSRASYANPSIHLGNKINPPDVISKSVRLNRDYALRRKIILKTEIVSEIEPINLDEKRTKQILTNLISNAVKYSREGSEVRIVAGVENGFLEIAVIDCGFGISKDQMSIAFSKYGIIANENSGKVDSFGLGLPIVKQLVELQNGSIEIKSTVGVGTEIKIKFPYR